MDHREVVPASELGAVLSKPVDISPRTGDLVPPEPVSKCCPFSWTKPGRITIAEVEELVEPGAIDPDAVHLPGIYVDRVVGPVPADDKGIEKRTVRKREERH